MEGAGLVDRCRHKGTPAEPFAAQGMYGVVNRIAPAGKGIPAMAHCTWGEDADAFSTWEALADITILKAAKR